MKKIKLLNPLLQPAVTFAQALADEMATMTPEEQADTLAVIDNFNEGFALIAKRLGQMDAYTEEV